MATWATSGTEQQSGYQEEALNLRVAALQRLLAAGLVGGTLWFLYVGVGLESRDLRLWSGPIVLVATSLLARRTLARKGFATATCLFVAGVALAVLLGTWAFPSSPVIILLAVPVGLTSLLMGAAAGFCSAGATGLLILLVLTTVPVSMRPAMPVLALTLILTLVMAVLLWVALYPLRVALEWAWSGYQQARWQTEELRARRAELVRTVKDLDAAYQRLEAMAMELERARRAALEAQRLKAEFAASISHELRTPLNLIIGFSEMMALNPQAYEGQALPPAYRGDVQAIYHNARHLASLIDDVLDLSQIEAGRMGLVRAPLALSEVVAEAVATVGPLLTAKGLWLRTDVPADLPTIQADRTRLRQVLINLLSNAARFTDRGGVTVSVCSDERDVTISVADTGVGIREEDMPRVFEAFRRLEGAVERHVAGSGLGLAISKKFVELHGGRMWVKSWLGEGSVFSFSLPLCAELGIGSLPAPSETWARVGAVPKEPILAVIDPNGAATHILERYLDGYRLQRVDSLQGARRMATAANVEGVVLVSQTGDVCEPLPADLPEKPLFWCTWQGLAATGLPGVVGCLTKPVTQERLMEALTALGHQVRSLLFVDDDEEVVRLLTRMVKLAPRRYLVQAAYGGAQALEAMRRRRPGAVLLDLLMPEIDGWQVLAAMQADTHLRSIPVVVVTAAMGEEDAVHAAAFGVAKRSGLSVGELTACLRASLTVLRPMGSVNILPAQPAAPAG